MSVRLEEPAVPEAVTAVARRVASTGRAAELVGECLADVLRGRPRRSWTLSTSAPATEIAGLFERAVPTAPAGRAWQVPTAAGPVDLLPRPAREPLAGVLARRALRIWAIAWSPVDGALSDPHDGTGDLRAGRLRTVGPAAEALRVLPCLALDVARLVGRHGERPDADLVRAMERVDAEILAACPAATRSRTLRAMLAGPHAGDAVSLLAGTGLARALRAGDRPDTPRLLAGAPADPAVRLAVWLRGARPSPFLRQHRIPPELGARVVALLAAHPLERRFSPQKRASLTRLARLPAADRGALLWLRRAELDAAPDDPATGPARRQLDALAEGLREHLAREAAARRVPRPVLDGAAVMEILGIDPGPRVGEALAFLRARVAADPTCNDRSRLTALLREWAGAGGRGDGRGGPGPRRG